MSWHWIAYGLLVVWGSLLCFVGGWSLVLAPKFPEAHVRVQTRRVGDCFYWAGMAMFLLAVLVV